MTRPSTGRAVRLDDGSGRSDDSFDGSDNVGAWSTSSESSGEEYGPSSPDEVYVDDGHSTSSPSSVYADEGHSSGSSSDGSYTHNHRWGGGDFVRSSGARNRRGTARNGSVRTIVGGASDGDGPSYVRRRVVGSYMESVARMSGKKSRRCPRACDKRSTVALLFSAFIWLYVQSRFVYRPSSKSSVSLDGGRKGKVPTPDLLKKLRERRHNQAAKALGSGAGKRKSKRGGSVEAIQKGCIPTEWQEQSFPNCNELHEIDLLHALHLRKKGPKLPNLERGDQSDAEITEEEATEASKVGYVGSGLWRQVWKVDPHDEVSLDTSGWSGRSSPAVLKMMKAEHDFNPRNFDRHRRDALVMEQLEPSPYVISIYGFCGQSVLTELAGQTLEEVIYKKGNVLAEKSDDALLPSRETTLGRLRLALDVSRGLAALHDVSGGPIVHADIQAKQFLVDPTTGTIKLNDFNRCRFMPRDENTGKPCTFRIPTAPGGNRSPEEYDLSQKLTEKLDVFSLGNVLFGILTGHKPWDENAKKIKKLVQAGTMPTIDAEYRVKGTSDAALAELVERAYENDPAKRISASELVLELGKIIADEDKQSPRLQRI